MTRFSCARLILAAITGLLLGLFPSLSGLGASAQVMHSVAQPAGIVQPASWFALNSVQPKGLAYLAKGAAAGKAANHQETVRLEMQQLSGLTKTGSPDPGKDGACKVKFGGLLNKTAITTYSITPSGQSAVTTFQSQRYVQHPLGIAGKYAFGVYFQPPRPPNSVYGDIFSISLTFTNPITNFVLVLDDQTNCLLSSGAKPLDEPESIRFGSSAK